MNHRGHYHEVMDAQKISLLDENRAEHESRSARQESRVMGYGI